MSVETYSLPLQLDLMHTDLMHPDLMYPDLTHPDLIVIDVTAAALGVGESSFAHR